MFAVLRHLLLRMTRRRSATHVRLEHLLGTRIHDFSLYERALRHRSIGSGQATDLLRSNERLEFLGDAVLGLVVAQHLYETFPDKMEGFLTPLRAKLVRGKALAEVARQMGLGVIIEMSPVAARHGGREQNAMLADALEAVIGALYLDRGLPAARRFIYRAMLDGVDLEALAARRDNFKSLLQEYTQARGLPRPTYQVTQVKGPPHARDFKVVVRVGEVARGKGRGKSKKDAEQRASRSALRKLNKPKGSTNPKGQLQQLAQARGWSMPRYKLLDTQGPDHAPLFTVELRVGPDLRLTQRGKSKKSAQRAAARKALEQLSARTAGGAHR